MGIVPRDGLRAGTRAAVLLLAVVAVSLLWGPRPADAAGPRAQTTYVSGYVKSVSGTELQVDNRTYDIAGVPIRTWPLRALSPAEIPIGAVAELHFRGGKLVLVFIGPNVVQ